MQQMTMAASQQIVPGQVPAAVVSTADRILVAVNIARAFRIPANRELGILTLKSPKCLG